jgi:hypothetical protein
MPAHELHLIIDMRILGRKYPQVHQFMDQFQKALQSNHRMYYHDMNTVMGILRFTGDPYAAESAYLHILLDDLGTKYGHAEAVIMLLDGIEKGLIKL